MLCIPLHKAKGEQYICVYPSLPLLYDRLRKRRFFVLKKSASRNIKILTTAAMLIALSATIAAICKLIPLLNLGVGLRITFENLPIIMAGMMFGPIIGACVGAAADLVSSLATGQDINFLITLGALSVGLVAGLSAKFIVRKKGVLRFALAEVLAQVIGSMTVKTIVLYTMFGSIVLFRIPIYVGIIVVEIVIFAALYKNRAVRRFIDSYSAEEKHELQ